jgi:hypothetical protein
MHTCILVEPLLLQKHFFSFLLKIYSCSILPLLVESYDPPRKKRYFCRTAPILIAPIVAYRRALVYYKDVNKN